MTRIITCVLLFLGLMVTGGMAVAGGSDDPTPYSVTAAGVTLPNGEKFQDNGHVNVRANQGDRGIHFESLNNQPSGKWIGKKFIPWSAFGYNTNTLCVTWVQLSQYNEHFGEGGQAPVGKGCETSEPPVKQSVCHPVNGKGETGNGWNIISPNHASSHIDEDEYPNGTYWKHESNDGLRHDVYAVNGTCPGDPVDEFEAYEVDACWTMSNTDGIENTYQFPQTYGCVPPKCEETIEQQHDTYWIRDKEDEATLEKIKAEGLDSPADDAPLEPHDYYSEVLTGEKCETEEPPVCPEGQIGTPPNCTVPPVDVCPNIEGNQSEIPAGYVKDDNGDCVLIPEEPPVSEPPVTEPPVTEPPVTEPPVTEPPVTEPPVTEPPVTEPPVTEPPTTEPPVTEPPTDNPPKDNPPAPKTPTTPELPNAGAPDMKMPIGLGLTLIVVGAIALMAGRKRA